MATGFGVTVDCRDPSVLAAFLRDLLGYLDDPPPEGYQSWADYDRENGVGAAEANAGASIMDPDGVLPRQTAIDAETERAVSLGATVLCRSPHADDLFTVRRDPEGNVFCLA